MAQLKERLTRVPSDAKLKTQAKLQDIAELWVNASSSDLQYE